MANTGNVASCVMCGAPTDWVTAKRAAGIIGVSDRQVLRLIGDGRLPGSVKAMFPGYNIAVWKVPLASVAALLASRQTT